MGGFRLNTEKFIERSKEIFNNKYDYSLTEYIDNKTDVIIKCDIHGEFKIKPNRHITGPKQGCKFCQENVRFYTNDSFINKAKQVHGEVYDYSKTVFEHVLKSIIIICPIHGEFKQTAGNHLQGAKCLKCYEKETRPTFEQVIDKFNKIHKGRYNYSNVIYINNYTLIKIICKEHGEFKQQPTDHATGSGCPRCKESNGETLIASGLIDLNIKFETEKKFKCCISKFNRPLRFDFYLPDYNMCIEYDGPQHFKMSTYFGKEAFENTQNNDKIKNEFCRDNGIKLLRIKYTDKHLIPNILKNNLSEEQ